MIWFEQHQDGRQKKVVKLSTPLKNGTPYSIEIRFDFYDFELLLDGRSIATMPSRFPSTPFGTVGVQARGARIRIEEMKALGPAQVQN